MTLREPRPRFHSVVFHERLCEPAGVGLFESVHRPGSDTGAHVHARPRLCLVVAGAFEEIDSNGRWIREPGALLLYPPEAEHDNRFSERGARCLNVELSDFSTGYRSDRPRVVDLGWRLASVGMRLYDALRGRADRSSLRALTERLLGGVAESRREADPEPSQHVLQARRLVEARAGLGITLSEVADVLGVSRFALARAFRAETGLSVGEYRHHVLVRRARADLLSTNDSLSAIAYRTGFADQSHFTRVFKRWTGLPPGEYRSAKT